MEQFPPKIEIALNFIYKIPLKINRTKTKVHQKIELTFSFTKEIPLKIIRNKKKSTLKFGLKNTLEDGEVGDHFSKNHPSSVILKIVENFFNLMTKLNPQEFWRKL